MGRASASYFSIVRIDEIGRWLGATWLASSRLIMIKVWAHIDGITIR